MQMPANSSWHAVEIKPGSMHNQDDSGSIPIAALRRTLYASVTIELGVYMDQIVSQARIYQMLIRQSLQLRRAKAGKRS